MLLGIGLFLLTLFGYFLRTFLRHHLGFFKPRKLKIVYTQSIRRQPKPDWVRKVIIRLKAFTPNKGCRSIAVTFNRLHSQKRKMTVGKTFVANVIKAHRYEILLLSRKIKHQQPKPLPKNLIWGMDLTQVTDQNKNTQLALGILDSGTRACITLKTVKTKASIILLRCLLDAVEQYGQPRFIRTDNERIFTSRLFRFGLHLLGIKHQRTDTHCPWQNGKVERFFGTLKNKIRQCPPLDFEDCCAQLKTFRLWYNHIRPHQNIGGYTPAEAWSKTKPNRNGKYFHYSAWNGVLSGIYQPPD